jgi:hypothetical protein
MEKQGGLTKAEREMIVVATSAGIAPSSGTGKRLICMVKG